MNPAALRDVVGFQIEDSSGDVVVEAQAASAGQALVEVARGLAAVMTGGSEVRAAQELAVEIGARDPAALLVAFVNELVFRFDTERFLVGGGHLEYVDDAVRPMVRGTLRGEAFDGSRHGRGVEVKAATFHGLRFEVAGAQVHLRVLLDL